MVLPGYNTLGVSPADDGVLTDLFPAAPGLLSSDQSPSQAQPPAFHSFFSQHLQAL